MTAKLIVGVDIQDGHVAATGWLHFNGSTFTVDESTQTTCDLVPREAWAEMNGARFSFHGSAGDTEKD